MWGSPGTVARQVGPLPGCGCRRRVGRRCSACWVGWVSAGRPPSLACPFLSVRLSVRFMLLCSALRGWGGGSLGSGSGSRGHVWLGRARSRRRGSPAGEEPAYDGAFVRPGWGVLAQPRSAGRRSGRRRRTCAWTPRGGSRAHHRLIAGLTCLSRSADCAVPCSAVQCPDLVLDRGQRLPRWVSVDPGSAAGPRSSYGAGRAIRGSLPPLIDAGRTGLLLPAGAAPWGRAPAASQPQCPGIAAQPVHENDEVVRMSAYGRASSPRLRRAGARRASSAGPARPTCVGSAGSPGLPGCMGSRGRMHQPRHAATEPTSRPQTTKNHPEQAVFNPKTHA